jgi:hypothetical protein
VSFIGYIERHRPSAYILTSSDKCDVP